jgi:hypothetical protein
MQHYPVEQDGQVICLRCGRTGYTATIRQKMGHFDGTAFFRQNLDRPLGRLRIVAACNVRVARARSGYPTPPKPRLRRPATRGSDSKRAEFSALAVQFTGQLRNDRMV